MRVVLLRVYVCVCVHVAVIYIVCMLRWIQTQMSLISQYFNKTDLTAFKGG